MGSRLLEVGIGSGMMVLLAVQPAAACTCAPPPLAEEIANTPAIFSGVVISVYEDNPYFSAFGVQVSILQTACWKGGFADTIRVYTPWQPPGSATCGVPFEVGVEWLVFAAIAPYVDGDKLVTSTCSSTYRMSEAGTVLAVLGPPKSVQVTGSTWGRMKAGYR